MVSLSGLEGTPCCAQAHTLQFIIFFPFHPSVLKPDLDLALGQTQGMGNLNPSPAGQVPIKMEFFLQLQRLVTGVGCPRPLAIRTCHICMVGRITIARGLITKGTILIILHLEHTSPSLNCPSPHPLVPHDCSSMNTASLSSTNSFYLLFI